MDVFSDVVATMKAGRAKLTRSRCSGRWGNRYGPYPGAGFHVVLKGACWLLPAEGRPVRMSAGDVVFLPNGSTHGMSDTPDRPLEGLPPLSPEGDGPVGGVSHHTHAGRPPAADDTILLCGAYRLGSGTVHPFLRGLPDVIHLPSEPGRHSELRAVVDLLSADTIEDRPGADAALPALLDLLLVYALRVWLEAQCPEASGGWCAALKDPAIGTALDRMHRDPRRPWSVRELAETAGLSRTAFAARFTAYVGQSPIAYLTWWRLSSAARLLRTTDAPIASVAHQVGYTSEYAFAHAFKREFGTAPGTFRRVGRDELPPS
ncbi:AraC family transcriptional regulator, partial [Streptomyces sp. NRRL S-118]|uniref:AraC family transcriptional regulator n=1 Tax=Streptomyces sp. NRRL S-118 TaxID=1463881 RepID=UPI0004C78B1D